ncbi:MAG TPA: hypothetical protein VFF58_00640 [Candidatus Nitrosotalea sp.]|nr:hypothetical protein [Candidatus Nitrosotalea sp.]
MTKKLNLASFFILALALCGSAFGQSLLTMTTLSAAVPGGQTSSSIISGQVGIVTVASATNINAPSPITALIATPATSTFLFVDRELMDVRAVSGTTITVVRGAVSTGATSHASGALVFVIPGTATWVNATGQLQAIPAGSCTRTNELFLPRIDVKSGTISDCLGGQWVNGDLQQSQRITFTGFRFPDPGATALTALETSGTAAAASTEIYCTEIDLPYSQLLTGLAPLNGTTVGTNKHFPILYDSSGVVLANGPTAGTTTAGASTYQKINFVTKYFAVGPARYFACDGLNGTTDTIRHALTSINDNVLGGAVTGQTFGTAAAVTVPSTFTTAKAPYYLLF